MKHSPLWAVVVIAGGLTLALILALGYEALRVLTTRMGG